MKAQIVRLRQELRRNLLPLRAPGIEPEKFIAVHVRLGAAESLRGGHQFLFGLVNFSCGVEMEDGTVGVLVICNGAFSGLPRGHGTEEHAVPIHIEEAFAVVVPHGGERTSRSQPLPVANESLNVPERGFGHRIDLVPIRIAGRNPGFDSVFCEGLDHFVEAAGAPVIPGHGDHVFGQRGNGVGIGVADVAPEKQAAVERGEFVVNLLEEVHIHRSITILLDGFAGAASAEIEGFIGADVDEWRGKLLRDLGEPILDERERAVLARGEHMAVRSFCQILIELVFEHVMQMAEGLLLRHNGDVILAGVGYKFRGLGGRKRTGWRRGQRLVRIKQRVLEIGRVDIDLECGEDANLVLLEFERGKRAAREIVINAPVFHRRPVASRARWQHAGCARQWQQLLEGLHAVKDTCAGRADNRGVARSDDENVALRFHDRIEGKMIARQDGLCFRGVRAQECDAIGLLCGGVRLIGRRSNAPDRVLQIARGELAFCIVAGHGDQNSSGKIGGLAKVCFARRGQKLDLHLCGAKCRRRHNGDKHCADEELSHRGEFETCQLRPP